MPRRSALAASAVASAVVFVLVATFWVRSWWVADFVSYKRLLEPGFSHFTFDSVQRSIHVGYYRTPASLPPGETAGLTWETSPSRDVRVLNDQWGFGFGRGEIWFPHLLLMLPSALLPLKWIIWRRRLRHRLANDLCLRCGYDLRASGGVCPECGSIPHGQPAAG